MFCIKCGTKYEGDFCPKCGMSNTIQNNNASRLLNSPFKKLALFSIGGVCLFLGLPFSVSLLAPPGLENLSLFIVGMVFVTVAAFCFIMAFRVIKREHKYNHYAALIGVRKKIPLNWIAQKMNKTVTEVIKDLHKAVSFGLFPNAHIDEKNGYLLFPNRDLGAMETVICPNCGAGVDIMTGYQSNCNFCGVILNQD